MLKVQAVLGAILPLTVFLVGDRHSERRAAQWGSFAAAVYTYVIYYGPPLPGLKRPNSNWSTIVLA
jgi:hypothetical protein